MHLPFFQQSQNAETPALGEGSRGISSKDYAFIRDLVYRTSRINLGDQKKELVSARLAKRLRATGIPSYSAYIDFIRTPQGEPELVNLIDVISTNHTFFMREMEHFSFLAREILPHVLTRRGADTEFRVWSAACSTGEEPYSAGIVISDALGEPSKVPWSCDCTDISTRVLETAKRGVYDSDRLRHVAPEAVRRHFLRGESTMAGYFQIRPQLKAHYRFHHLNLLGGAYPFSRPFHLIFCRNVMIYFDRATQEDLVGRLSRQLAPGGHLFIGHAESLAGVKNELRPIKPAIYRKPA
jgi:chemotaxis protein methyltransferase CheR